MKNIFLIVFIISGSIIGQSLNINYSVEQKINGDAKDVGEYNFVEYSVKSNDGKELYQIVDKVDYDIPYSKLEVFEDGSSVLISSFYGTLTFISNDGTEIKSVKISDSIKVEYERSIHSVTDDESLLILFEERNGKTSIIKKYINDGTLEREIRIPITNVNGIAYSAKLDQIYLSHTIWGNSGELSKKVMLLNGSEVVAKSFEVNFEKGFFIDNKQFIGVLNKSIFSISTSELKLRYEVKADENSIFIDVAEKDNTVVIAQAKNPKLENGEWYYKNPIIIKLDSAGKIIRRVNIETDFFTKYKFQKNSNILKFVAGNKSIVVD